LHGQYAGDGFAVAGEPRWPICRFIGQRRSSSDGTLPVITQENPMFANVTSDRVGLSIFAALIAHVATFAFVLYG